MSNKYKILLATIFGAASVFFFAVATDCPGTANYVYCGIKNDGAAWVVLAIMLEAIAVCIFANVTLSWSDDNEN